MSRTFVQAVGKPNSLIEAYDLVAQLVDKASHSPFKLRADLRVRALERVQEGSGSRLTRITREIWEHYDKIYEKRGVKGVYLGKVGMPMELYPSDLTDAE